jgi:hypothetical protein
MTRPLATLDVECYINYLLIKLLNYDTRQAIAEFEMINDDRRYFNMDALRMLLAHYTIVTFNGLHYDMHIVNGALAGYDNANLKYLSDQIIQGGLRYWEVERQYRLYTPEYVDHIDLIEVAPGQHSLKTYGGKMHSRKIQDLPIRPDQVIQPEDVVNMREYCGNDCVTTCDLYKQFKTQIELRATMSELYGLDLRSKSDAQIAEAVIKSEADMYIEKPVWMPGTSFKYDVPDFIVFHTPVLQELLATVRNVSFILGDASVMMPPELAAASIRMGVSCYTLGIGGLHSTESCVNHVDDEETMISDHDVAGFYPAIFMRLGLYPPQIGPKFLEIFDAIIKRRLHAKKTGDKTTADSLKITVNGTFGKTLSSFGYLSAPKLGIQTTITGQLSLLMLIEAFELNGLSVISANTDGVVVKTPRAMQWLRDSIIADWERRTGFETEEARYHAVYSRDVNNYIAVKYAFDKTSNQWTRNIDGVKLKGEYASPVPVGGSWPNPTGEICVIAVVDYLTKGIPLMTTIRACTDVRKFVYVRNVKGGGEWIDEPYIEKATRKGDMTTQLLAAGWMIKPDKTWTNGTQLYASVEMKEAYKLAIVSLRDHQDMARVYCGKVARWYYAAGSNGVIVYCTSKNKVPKSEGSRPLMVLPDVIPPDIDYDWYEREAVSLLADMNMRYDVK